MRTRLAVIDLFSRQAGFDPRHADLEQASLTWMVVDCVQRALGCSERIGRHMARQHMLGRIPDHDIECTLSALEDEAAKVATPAFVEQVRLIASQVY